MLQIIKNKQTKTCPPSSVNSYNYYSKQRIILNSIRVVVGEVFFLFEEYMQQRL